MYYNGTRIRTVEGIWNTLFITLTVLGTVEDCISAIRAKGRYTPAGSISQILEVTALNGVSSSHMCSSFPLKSVPTRSYTKYLRTEAPKGHFIAHFHSPLLSTHRFKSFITVPTEGGSEALRHAFQGGNNQALPVQNITSRLRVAWEIGSSIRAGIAV